MTAVSVFFARLQYLIFQMEYIHRHTWTLLHLKNRHRYNVAAHPFLTLPLPTRAWGTLLAPAQFHNRSLADPPTWQAPAQNAALLEELTRTGLDPSEWRGECPENGALEQRSHWHGTFHHVARQTRRQPCKLYYISRDQPNAHELTNHIRHPSLEPGLRSPGTPESGGAGGVGLSPCHQLIQPAVLPGYSESVLRTGLGFCGRARIQLANQWSQAGPCPAEAGPCRRRVPDTGPGPTNLNKCNKVNNLNNFNNLHNYNNCNNLNKEI